MYRDRVIAPNNTIFEALKKMDSIDKKLLIVIDDKQFLGLLSIGDIQRAIISNTPLETKIFQILRKEFKVAIPEDSLDDIKEMMFKFRMELCPVVNINNDILKVYFWEDFYSNKEHYPKSKFNLPVVIMAGGFGTRLKPITNVLPKPLIPIGQKTIIENIFDRFSNHGSNNFYISVNYKAEFIEYYLNSLNLPYQISYFKESKPMGTGGSLSLLKGKINQTFFVSNCDILIEQDYSEVLEYHKLNNNEITIVAVLKTYSIPYGTIETGINGTLKKINEKPDLTFKINSGMYILEPHLLEEVPCDTFFHITDLIEKIVLRNGKVGVFPINEKSWKDIGDWDEYLKQNISEK